MYLQVEGVGRDGAGTGKSGGRPKREGEAMKDDLGLSALVRTAHEYAKRKAACRKEWAVSIASARALNAALDALAVAAVNYSAACAQLFKSDGPSAAPQAPPEAKPAPEMAVYAWCSVCEGTGIEQDDDGRWPCTESNHER